jgi:hypothetical protein
LPHLTTWPWLTGVIDPYILQEFTKLGAKLARYAPRFKGYATTETTVKDVLSVLEFANVRGGHGGAFLSHFGNKQWV